MFQLDTVHCLASHLTCSLVRDWNVKVYIVTALRVTGISRLYSSGVPEKLIIERSGRLRVAGVYSHECMSDQR